MRTIFTNFVAKDDFWRHLIALTIFVLTLFSVALDRRNVVYGRDTADARAVEHQVQAPSAEEMVREMMTHD